MQMRPATGGSRSSLRSIPIAALFAPRCTIAAEESIAINWSHIFDPFFTTKRGGLGLGLGVCHSIIAAHGGRLWAANNPERGAAFHFTLPVAIG